MSYFINDNNDHLKNERSRREHTEFALAELSREINEQNRIFNKQNIQFYDRYPELNEHYTAKIENYRIIKQLYTFSSYSAVFEVMSADGTVYIVKAIDCLTNEMAYPEFEKSSDEKTATDLKQEYIRKIALNELEVMKKLLLCQYTVPLLSYYEYKTEEENVILFFFPKLMPAEEYFAVNGLDSIKLAKFIHDISCALEELHNNRMAHGGVCSDHVYYSEKDDRFLLGDMASEGRYDAINGGIYTAMTNSISNSSGDMFPDCVPDFQRGGIKRENTEADIYMLGELAYILNKKFNRSSYRRDPLSPMIEKCRKEEPEERYSAKKLAEVTEKYISEASGKTGPDKKSPSEMRCIEYFRNGRLEDAIAEAETGHDAGMKNMTLMLGLLLGCKYKTTEDKDAKLNGLHKALELVGEHTYPNNGKPFDPAARFVYSNLLALLLQTDEYRDRQQEFIECINDFIITSAEGGFSPAQYTAGCGKNERLYGLSFDGENGRKYLLKAQAALYAPAAEYLNQKKNRSQYISQNDVDNGLLRSYKQEEEAVHLLRALAEWK